MARYLFQTRLSDHLALTPENYLIATGCVLCRSGDQQYMRSELDESSNSDEVVTVNRPVDEVTSPTFLASLPGKSFVVQHPSSGLVTSDTHAWSARGTVLRAYVGDELDEDGNTLILGDIVIHDPTAIQRVLNGQRQLSVGYKYELGQGAEGLEMRNLIANHVALVEQGRAGNAMIVDSALSWGGSVNAQEILPGGEGDEPMSSAARKATAIDDDQIPDESEDSIPMPKTKDEDNALAEKIDKLCALLEQLFSRKAEDDALVPVATLPKSARPENPVVGDLRRLRPVIEASGDRRAIDAFNTAMLAAKRGNPALAQEFIAACDSTARTPELSWSDMLAIRAKELLEGKAPSELTDYKAAAAALTERRALDAKAAPESYEQQIKRAGEKMRNSKFPRG